MARNLTRQMGTPAGMAKWVVFRAIAAASCITGTNLVMDGALTCGMQFQAALFLLRCRAALTTTRRRHHLKWRLLWTVVPIIPATRP